MISDAAQEHVIKRLVPRITPVEMPREMLTAHFFDKTFPQELRQGNPRALDMDAVRRCLVNVWNHDPPYKNRAFQG